MQIIAFATTVAVCNDDNPVGQIAGATKTCPVASWRWPGSTCPRSKPNAAFLAKYAKTVHSTSEGAVTG
jgi:hypothetical protein